MKNKIAVILVFLTSIAQSAHGNHLLGGELFYKHISNNTYEINLVLYSDCSSTSQALQGLYSSRPTIIIKSRSGAGFITYDSLKLDVQQPVGQEITPLCPSELQNSSCNGGSLPGIQKFIYKGYYNLPPMTTTTNKEWSIEFHGVQNWSSGGNNYQAGRSYLITNIGTLPGGTPTTLNLRAYLNRSYGENNSPTFTSLPTPFYCINKPQTYNIAAVDSSIDQLSYSLVPALQNNGNSVVSYVSGYSATAPIATSTPLNFNPVNGQLSFTPNVIQNSVVVYQVTETRNGQIVGSSMREMTFVVLDNCNNDAPTANISNGVNITINGDDIVACGGQPIQADFTIGDPNNNNIYLEAASLPPGATLNITNNNTSTPSLTFNWPNPTSGIHVFYVTLTDDGCPLAVRLTKAFTVEIVDLPEPTFEVIEPTNCTKKAKVKFTYPNIGNYGPVDVVIKNSSGATLSSFNTNLITSIDSFDVGNYTIQIFKNPEGCESNIVPFEIVDSGTFEYPPDVITPVYYCVDDTPVALEASANSPYSPTYQTWYYNGSTIPGPPTPSTTTQGIYSYAVTETYKTCESDPRYIIVYVSEPPGNNFSYINPVCQYDTILVRYDGHYTDSNGIAIDWNFGSAVVVDSGTSFDEVYISFPYSGTFTIGIDSVSEYQCYGDSAYSTIRVIPSALTKIYGDTTACQYQPVTFSNTILPNPNTDYTWSFGDSVDVISQNKSVATVVFNSPGVKEVTLTAASDSCSYTSTHTITVYPKPVIDIRIQEGELCLGDTVIARVDTGVKVWFEPEVFVRADRDSPNVFYLTILQPQSFTIYSQGEGGCTDTAYVDVSNIKDCCHYFIPNAFTPNNDGQNDEFEVWFEGNPKNYRLQIFNRWGESIFSSLSKYDSWDGTHEGKEVELDTYFYLLQGECYENNLPFQETGDVTLIK